MRTKLLEYYTRIFFHDAWYFYTTLAGIAGNACIWALIWWRSDLLYKPGENIALHYKVFFGIDFLGEWYYILIIPMTGLGIVVLNYFLARRSYPYQKAVTYALTLTGVGAQVILLWALYLIIQTNIF